MTKDLKPCPFCGNKDVEVEIDRLAVNDFIHYAECGGCLARGGTEKSILEAEEAWNRRAND